MTLVQAAGSAMTYGRRYLLINIFNLAISNDPNDDDGEGGVGAFVNAEQIAELEKLIKDSDTKLDQFLAFGKVESLAEIPAVKFASAKALLEQKIAIKKQKA